MNCSGNKNIKDFVCSNSFQQFEEVAQIIEKEYERISSELFISTQKTKQIEKYLHENGSNLSDNSKKHLIQVSSIIGN